MRSRPTDEEFDKLKADRDAGVAAAISAFRKSLGWPEDGPAHINFGGGTPTCYCACPDGPCQHLWDGPSRDILDDRDLPCGEESTCSRCGLGAMSHSLRTGP